MILENNYIRHNVDTRNRNKIYFEKPEKVEKEYYGLNRLKKCIKCFSIEMLPYNLMIYESEPIEVKKNKNNNLEIFEFVTCQDSIFFDKNLNHKEELDWRQNLIMGDVIDFWCNKEKKWVNGKIKEIRNDVIECIFKIIRRKSLELLGFVYFESKNIAKNGTHTESLSQEDLIQELKLEKKQLRQNKHFIELRENQINKKLKKLKVFYSEHIELNGFIKDILPLYFEMKFTEPFTREEVDKLYNVDNQILKNASLSFLSLVKINSPDGYDGMIFNDINKYMSENIPLGYDYDGYYNIQIKAKDDFVLSKLIKNDVKLFIGGEVNIIGFFNQEKNIIEFPDFVEKNPLLQLSTQKYYISCSDFYENIPIICSYTAIKLNTFYRALLLKNYFTHNRITKDNIKYIIFSNILKTFQIEEEKLYLK